MQPVVDALEKPEFAKFASQPLDAAGLRKRWDDRPRDGLGSPGITAPTAWAQELRPYTWQCLEGTLSLHRPGKSVLDDVANEKEEMLNWTASLYVYSVYIYIHISLLCWFFRFYRCVDESSWTVEGWGLANHRTHRFVSALCQELLNARCAVDSVDGNGQEPLHVAAIEGHSDLVLATWLKNKKSHQSRCGSSTNPAAIRHFSIGTTSTFMVDFSLQWSLVCQNIPGRGNTMKYTPIYCIHFFGLQECTAFRLVDSTVSLCAFLPLVDLIYTIWTFWIFYNMWLSQLYTCDTHTHIHA